MVTSCLRPSQLFRNFGLTFRLSLEDETDRLSKTSVNNYQPTLSSIPEVRGRRLKISLGFFMEEMEAAGSSETLVGI